MLTQKLRNDTAANTAFKIFDGYTAKTAKKWRPFGRAFFWVTSAIASWMLFARLAELVIGD